MVMHAAFAGKNLTWEHECTHMPPWHIATPSIFLCQNQPWPSLHTRTLHAQPNIFYKYQPLPPQFLTKIFHHNPITISYHNSSTMAKLSAVAALLAALLLIAHATAYYRESGESCSKQLQQQQVLNHCQMYLSQQCQSGRFDSNTYDESQRFQLCCRQLKMMDIGCRCDGLNIMMRELMREVPGRREIQKMMQMAQNLPNQCNMKPRRCEMEMLSFRYQRASHECMHGCVPTVIGSLQQLQHCSQR